MKIFPMEDGPLARILPRILPLIIRTPKTTLCHIRNVLTIGSTFRREIVPSIVVSASLRRS